MPWCQIKPESLKHIEMFGYTILHQDEERMLAQYHDGRIVGIKKAKPWLLFDEIEEAMQLGVIGVIQGPS